MDSLVKNIVVSEDIERVCNYKGIDYNLFKNKIFYITGVTGTIGSFIASCLLEMNNRFSLNLKIIGAVRDEKKAKKMFCENKGVLRFVYSDVIEPVNYEGDIDYIIHCASNTASRSFVEKPVETFNIAVKGTENILNLARCKNVESMVFLSSMEVYGTVETPVKLKENTLGALDMSEPRNSYPIGKRAAETLCFLSAKEHNIPVKIVRLAQVIGANAAYNDTRVYAQFARSIVERKNIILNTPAKTTRSYCYITDAVTGIFTVLLNGENAGVYNISNDSASIQIRDMAKMLTERYPASGLVFDIKDDNPYFKETHWVLDTSKISTLGWHAEISLGEALNKLINSFYYQSHKNIIGFKYKNLKERLFSIKNGECHKIVSILGIPIMIPFSFINNVEKIHKKYGIIKNKIVFSNYMGNNYGCNPKYITEELLKRNLNLDIVWLVNQDIELKDFPSQVRIVKHSDREALFELATAKVWVDNYHKIKFINRGLIKYPEQKYIQTWHGSLGIKKIEKQVKSFNKASSWACAAAKNSEMTDYWISNSKFETDVYKQSFWEVKDIKEFGHPRNDIFFGDTKDIKEKVYRNYGIDKNKKIALYVPSFREDESLLCYNLDYKRAASALSKRLGGEWIFLVRFHPRVARFADSLLDDSVINATKYCDVQELLVSSDVAITDYSSCIFDFMLSRRPAFIYADDIEKYDMQRGFYYPLSETPFPIASDNNELINNILNFDNDKYQKEVEQFLREKGCIEDGNASKRTVDLIEEIMGI